MEEAQSGSDEKPFKVILALANGYLVAFAADALLSLFDDSLRFAGVSILEGIRNAVASWVVCASYLMAVLLVFIPRLPKLLLLPPVFFALWADLGAPPLGGMKDGRFYGIAMDLAQTVFGAGTFLALRMWKGRWFLRAESFAPKNRLLLRIALTILVFFAGGTLLFVGAVLWQAKTLIEAKAGNAMRLTWSGVDLLETVLIRKGQRVRLVAMAHIGKAQFYEALYSGFPEHALVLEEGVSDRKGILSKKFSYQNFAGVLGYTQQPSVSAWQKQLPSEGGEGSSVSAAARFDVVGADIDVSEFSDSTIAFLKQVGEWYQSRNLRELSARFSAFQQEMKTDQTEKFFEEVVRLRNNHLLKVFDARSPGYSHVVIPWGALHMPGLEKELLKRGFVVESRRYLPHARYRDLLSRK